MRQYRQQQTLSAAIPLLLLIAVSKCVGFQTPHYFATRSTFWSSSSPSTARYSNAEDVVEGEASVTAGTSYVRCGRCEAVYSILEGDLGRGKGRRLECSVCGHSWFQSKDRIMEVKSGYQMVPLPEADKNRISLNIEEGKDPKFMGDVKLYVGNVAFECHEDDIFEIFSRVGNVGDVSLVRDDDGKNRGFGFVTMRTKEEGHRAIEELDGASVRGRNIAVRESNN